MKDELKPCPFCGGEAFIYKAGYGLRNDIPHDFAVICRTCRAATKLYFNNPEDAIEAWNRRAYETD